jgi:hypothetical protein
MPFPAASAVVARWLVDMPGAHALWHFWQLSVVHLRPVPDGPPARKILPGATHEVVFLAVDPERCPVPDPDALAGLPYLLPVDVVEQVELRSDGDAAHLLEGALDPILKGQASPDQDFRRFWCAFFNGLAETLRSEK